MTQSPLAPELPTAPPINPGGGPGLGRLFLVPLLIVSVLVGCAALVVLMFGWIGTGKEQKLDTLMNVIEQSQGYRNAAGGMWPKEKEVWQAAQELAVRLEHKDAEIPLDQRPELARRLAAALDKTLHIDPAGLTPKQRESLVLRERFLTRALGMLALPECVSPLVAVLAEPLPESESLRDHHLARKQYAAEAVALMPDVSGVADAVPVLARIIEDRDLPVPPRLVCVAALSVIAERGAAVAVDALAAAYAEDDREMKWNAALGLARLGSTKSRPLLREMLAREYWSADDMAVLTGPDGVVYRARLTAIQIDGYLIAAIDAVRVLGDAELMSLVDELVEDPSVKVRQAALRPTPESPVAEEVTD